MFAVFFGSACLSSWLHDNMSQTHSHKQHIHTFINTHMFKHTCTCHKQSHTFHYISTTFQFFSFFHTRWAAIASAICFGKKDKDFVPFAKRLCFQNLCKRESIIPLQKGSLKRAPLQKGTLPPCHLCKKYALDICQQGIQASWQWDHQ